MRKIYKTADLCDAYYDQGLIQICHPVFIDYGKHRQFHGEVSTIRCFEDNSRVREAVSRKSNGGVLVIDAGRSQRCAMLGDILAARAVTNGWAGIVINGLIRDSAEIANMQIGVKALGTLPLKSIKLDQGIEGVDVAFAGVRFIPGSFLYADEDGIICSAKQFE